MNQNTHRLGVSEVNLVKRRLELKPCKREKIDAAMQEIDRLFGIDAVSFDDDAGKLELAYDASRLCLDCVEEALTNNGVEISDGWWTRFKEDYYKFVDQNVKDKANEEPWSCH